VEEPSRNDLWLKVGELAGAVRQLSIKVDDVAEDVKSLLARESERTGREAEEDRAADADIRRVQMWLSLVSGGIGGVLATFFQLIGRKLGWMP
jgi:outer membrane murein-binding lipoprotein Lpp